MKKNGDSLDFKPFPFLRGPHQQTMLGWGVNFPVTLPSVEKIVLLPDNDQITYQVSEPQGWQPTDRTVILLHGLCGCADSPFILRIAKRLVDRGLKVVRANMRGCGKGGMALARKTYHSGRSEDVAAILKQVKASEQNSPISLVGFSLGGNIVLKYAGEAPTESRQLCDQVVGICPATDVLASARLLGLSENERYQSYFVNCLKTQLLERHEIYPELPPHGLPENFSLFEFDQLYTAPQCGFRSALDYYRQVSAARLIPDITIPTKILFAADDPFIDWTALNGLSLPNNLNVHLTRQGGHMGYIGSPRSKGGYRWLDSQIERWVTDFG
jgi:predicted alpha/beta-fold hydrolase